MPKKVEYADMDNRTRIADQVLNLTDTMQNALDALIGIEHDIRMGRDVTAEERQLVGAAGRFALRFQNLASKLAKS